MVSIVRRGGLGAPPDDSRSLLTNLKELDNQLHHTVSRSQPKTRRLHRLLQNTPTRAPWNRLTHPQPISKQTPMNTRYSFFIFHHLRKNRTVLQIGDASRQPENAGSGRCQKSLCGSGKVYHGQTRSAEEYSTDRTDCRRSNCSPRQIVSLAKIVDGRGRRSAC